MVLLERIVAAHPLSDRKPYDQIRFVRVDGQGTPLYAVGTDKRATGAYEALRTAAKQFGGECFHCGKRMEPQVLSQSFTRDHLLPKCEGGRDFLHNLVLACGKCNKSKGGSDLVSYRPKKGREYLRALDAHLVRWLQALSHSG